MARPVIRLRRSSVPGKIPNPGNLQTGEFAVNYYDGKVYIKQEGPVGFASTSVVVNPWNVGLGSDQYNIHFTAGFVGIGTASPQFPADVGGDLRITQSNKLRFGGNTGSTNFYIQYNPSTNSLDFVAG